VGVYSFPDYSAAGNTSVGCLSINNPNNDTTNNPGNNATNNDDATA
jgi:hypothetical protein